MPCAMACSPWPSGSPPPIVLTFAFGVAVRAAGQAPAPVLLIVVGAGGLSAQRALWARRYPRERAG